MIHRNTKIKSIEEILIVACLPLLNKMCKIIYNKTQNLWNSVSSAVPSLKIEWIHAKGTNKVIEYVHRSYGSLMIHNYRFNSIDTFAHKK